MPNYIVNKNAQYNSGDPEVHLKSAFSSPRYPDPANREDLGWHSDCHGAVAEAKRRGYRTANGCYYCSNPCHTS